MDSRPRSKPLVRCAVCSSDLIYPVHCAPHGAQRVVDRRCPECDNHDRVITSRLAAELWYRRNACIAEELEALADALAHGLGLAVPPRFR
jgi:DNA-binding transcriptional LysR family regulator